MRKAKQGLVHEKKIRPHIVLEFEEFTFFLGEKVRARFGGEEPKVWFAFTPFCVGFFFIQVK